MLKFKFDLNGFPPHSSKSYVYDMLSRAKAERQHAILHTLLRIISDDQANWVYWEHISEFNDEVERENQRAALKQRIDDEITRQLAAGKIRLRKPA